MNVSEHIHLPRNSQKEKELARMLRGLPEEERFDFVLEYIKQNEVVGLWLAKTCLQNPKFFSLLFVQGMETANSSSIRLWIDSILPKLGIKKVLRLLSEKVVNEPRAVENVMYWLPSYITGENEAISLQIQQLKQDAAAK